MLKRPSKFKDFSTFLHKTRGKIHVVTNDHLLQIIHDLNALIFPMSHDASVMAGLYYSENSEILVLSLILVTKIFLVLCIDDDSEHAICLVT